METIADRLKQARLWAGYKTAQAAVDAMSNVPYGTYSTHENGSRAPSRKAAMRYASFFRVTLDWLLNARGDPKAGFSKLPANLDEADQELVSQYADFLRSRKPPSPQE